MLREAARLRRGVSTAATKIRKRCAVSPSWELRAKRSVRLIGRSVGAASHCPSSSSSCSRIKRRMMSEPSWTNRRCRRHAGVEVETRSAASARKLVTALWQHGKGGSAFEEEDEEEGEVGWDDAAAKRRSSSDHRGSASVEVVSAARRAVPCCMCFVVSLSLGRPALNLFCLLSCSCPSCREERSSLSRMMERGAGTMAMLMLMATASQMS